MNPRPVKKIQREIFSILMILVTFMTVIVAAFSILVNLRSEKRSLDENLLNIAGAVAQSSIVSDELSTDAPMKEITSAYMDAMKHSVSNIDVISLVDKNNLRHYHTNESLAGTVYDGTVPDFASHGGSGYVESSIGPSGSQRRAYAPVYDANTQYCGFVIAVVLNRNINRIVLSTIFVHLFCMAGVIALAVILSSVLSKRIKDRLLGYEPDTFSEMFSVRNDILDSLEEGIVAVGRDNSLIYMNKSASSMTDGENAPADRLDLGSVMATGNKDLHIPIRLKKDADIIADKIPVSKNGRVTGAVCILRDRTELTKLADDLSGVHFLVESMRANNHDFTNKLHVILGLIQMGETKEAAEYITNLTSIKQSGIHRIMKVIGDPTVCALLIGKYSRAAELNIDFTVESDSRLCRDDISLPSGDIVTIVGNLIENAMDALNSGSITPKQLSVGIFTQPHAMIINVDDTAGGIPEGIKDKIFDRGFSTKGENRGTGLYLVNELAKKYNGSVSFESEDGVGTSFTVTLTD